IRNRLKINAIIENARVLQKLRKSHGGLAGFVAQHHPLTKKEWTKLFKKQFKFMGGEIVGEFLMSTGYLPGAHAPNCPVYKKLKKDYDLPWVAAQKKGFKY
nr:DNA-3-methyladenine glycosylase I [Alphaproteobacteria bacterium]